MMEIEGNIGANCRICHKPPKDIHETYLGSFGFMEAGVPWIPVSHRLCRLRRLPVDIFWILATIIAYPFVITYEKITGKEVK